MQKMIHPFVADAKIINAIAIPVSLFLWLRVPAWINEGWIVPIVLALCAVSMLAGMALLVASWWRTPNCKAVHACEGCHRKAKRQLKLTLLVHLGVYPAMLLAALIWGAFLSFIFTGSPF